MTLSALQRGRSLWDMYMSTTRAAPWIIDSADYGVIRMSLSCDVPSVPIMLTIALSLQVPEQ